MDASFDLYYIRPIYIRPLYYKEIRVSGGNYSPITEATEAVAFGVFKRFFIFSTFLTFFHVFLNFFFNAFFTSILCY